MEDIKIANALRDSLKSIQSRLMLADKKTFEDVFKKVCDDINELIVTNISEVALLEAKVQSLQNEKEALDAEITRLGAEICVNAETMTGCSCGPWCKDCKHLGKESAKYTAVYPEKIFSSSYYPRYFICESGVVRYCKKHIHDICPEFNLAEGNGKLHERRIQ